MKPISETTLHEPPLSVPALAAILTHMLQTKVDVQVLYRMARDGRLPSIRTGHKLFIPRPAARKLAEAWMQGEKW